MFNITPVDNISFILLIILFFVIPFGTSLYTIIALLLLTFWIFSGRFWKYRQYIYKSSWFYPVSVYILLTISGILWSSDPTGLGIKFLKKTHYWLYTAIITYLLFVFKDKIEYVFKALLLGLFVNFIVALLQIAHLFPIFSRWGMTRYTGFYGGYNTLPLLLSLGAGMSSFYLRGVQDKKDKIIYGILLISFICHIILIESRGGYITFLSILPFIIYNMPFKRFSLNLLLIIICLLLFLISPISRNRINQTTEAFKDYLRLPEDIRWGKVYYAPLDRIYMWRWALELFKENPFLGVGTGGYSKGIVEAGGKIAVAHPHNNILYMASSYGIVGIFVYFWIMGLMFLRSIRHLDDTIGAFIFCSSLVIFFGGLTDTPILNSGGLILLSLTMGLTSFYDPIQISD